MISLLGGRGESQPGSCFLFMESLPRKVLNEEWWGARNRWCDSSAVTGRWRVTAPAGALGQPGLSTWMPEAPWCSPRGWNVPMGCMWGRGLWVPEQDWGRGHGWKEAGLGLVQWNTLNKNLVWGVEGESQGDRGGKKTQLEKEPSDLRGQGTGLYKFLLSGRGISHGEGSFPRPPQHCILLHFYILPYHMGQKWCFFGLNCVS